MYSDGRQSTRSPTNSRSDSYRNGASVADAPGRLNPRADSGPYQRRSSILESDEREDNDYEQALYDSDEGPAETARPPAPPRNEDPYVSALRYRFPNRAKSDYVYSKPAGPTSKSFFSFVLSIRLMFVDSSSCAPVTTRDEYQHDQSTASARWL